MMASRSLTALAAGLTLVSEGLAQSVNETVWASFAYVLYGERTPFQGDLVPSLTPLGAQQLYAQGSLFRARYLSNSSLSNEDNAITTNSPIVGIQRQALDNSQLSIFSITDDYVVASALAFLQGLYPPVTQTFASNNGGDNASTLANGTVVNYPLGGYQYPNIQNVPITDPNSVWLEGYATCTEYWSSSLDFQSSDVAQNMYNATSFFYERTWEEVFPNTIPDSMLNFDYAYDLYDYAQYAYDHDKAVRDSLNEDRLAILRDLASKQQFNLNGDLSVSGSQEGDMIRAIGGRTLAAKVVTQLRTHMNSAGSTDKMTLMFGSFEPLLAFFSLADLINVSGMFSQIPDPGAAIVFELFTTDENVEYPREDNSWVRFLYRNGSGRDVPLTEYPLFGRGNSETRMTWTDFQTAMDKFAIWELSDWCNVCSSVALFCSALSQSSGSLDEPSSSSNGVNQNNNASLSPTVAGVIGALTTLAVLGLAGVTAFVFGGIRIRRRDSSEDASRRRSSLGGFKGAEKMASDHDVSVAKNGARHERVGSWELGAPSGIGNIATPAPVAVPGSGSFGVSRRNVKDDDEDSLLGASPVDPIERV
ncbi:phosphoglycerate mutase-like protein [Daldinia decipiens]|uniref:phosphoglycerate mutase-like protein n=1 Tax=Daldinia decipiens TaxID=326647 RepID=UPI0020C3D4A7|nr:phosphoglycerate mutase-like protein [Daldinia decipiens]KAI1656560.1 phosphoglycerate mutase-like protein [Daldinia decipiens]